MDGLFRKTNKGPKDRSEAAAVHPLPDPAFRDLDILPSSYQLEGDGREPPVVIAPGSQRQEVYGHRPRVRNFSPPRIIERSDLELGNRDNQFQAETEGKGKLGETPLVLPVSNQEVTTPKVEEPQSKDKEPNNEGEEAQINDKESQSMEKEPQSKDKESHNFEKELQNKEKERQKKEMELYDLYSHLKGSKSKREKDFQEIRERYEQESRELENRYEKEKELRSEVMKLRNDHKQLWDQHEQLLNQYLEEWNLRSRSEKKLEAVVKQHIQVGNLYEDEKKARNVLGIEIQELRNRLKEDNRLRYEYKIEKEDQMNNYEKKVYMLNDELPQLPKLYEQEIMAQYEEERKHRMISEREFRHSLREYEKRLVSTKKETNNDIVRLKTKYEEQLDSAKKEMEDKILRLTIEFEEQLTTATEEMEDLLRQISRERQRLSDKNIAQELLSKDKVLT